MSFTVVAPATITAGRGPVTAFEVYQVELPPGESTEPHTHFDDQVEDVYVVIRGDGLVLIAICAAA